MSLEIDIFSSMVNKHLQHEISKNVDFSRCHTTWSAYSLDLREVSNEHLGGYYIIAFPAMTMNLLVLVFGVRYIWKQRFIQGTLQLFFSTSQLYTWYHTFKVPAKTGGSQKLSCRFFASCTKLDLLYRRF